MELTIKDIAIRLGLSENAVSLRLIRRGIKPVRVEEVKNSRGLVYKIGYYEEGAVNTIVDKKPSKNLEE